MYKKYLKDESRVIIMQITFNEMLKAMDGEVIVQGKEIKFNKICIDTRKVEKDNVFLAIKGANFNGNDFALKASIDQLQGAISEKIGS